MTPAHSPYIARYFEDKAGALSLTFDDGFRHQVEDALEVLDPLGLKGTFFLIPHPIDDPEVCWNFIPWKRVSEMIANGHEMGTHDTIREKLHEIDAARRMDKIDGNQRRIAEKTGVTPISYALPGGSLATPEVIDSIRRKHLFVRQESCLPHSRILGYGRTKDRDWSDAETRATISEACDKGEWVIPIIHAITRGWSPFHSKDEFRIHCEYLKSIEDRLWIAPMGTVGRYVWQRESSTLTVTGTTDHSVSFTVTHHLPEWAALIHPITVVFPGLSKEAITLSNANQTPVVSKKQKDRVLVSVVPDGSETTLSWSGSTEFAEDPS